MHALGQHDVVIYASGMGGLLESPILSQRGLPGRIQPASEELGELRHGEPGHQWD